MWKTVLSKSDEEWNLSNQRITAILQKVKVKLMSRDLEQQKGAVAWLSNELNVNSTTVKDILILTLLKSEIIALLCETTMTMQGQLVTSTLKCLANLTTSEQFYKQNHASYVIASILRTGHFLTLESEMTKDRLIMLESIAYTLEKIFEGATGFRVSPNEICELMQIFEFLKKLLTAESQAYRIVFSAAKILSFVLGYAIKNKGETHVNEGSQDAGELVFTVVDATLKLMRRILEAKNPNDGKYAFRAMVMTCAVCATAIPLCSQSSDPSYEGIGPKSSSVDNYRVNIAKCVYAAMMKAVIPNFDKIDQDDKNGQFYMWFVTCLNDIYDVDYCNSKDLSNYLAEQGFLQILPRLTTLPTQNLRNETLLLLSRILNTLASLSLSTETWLGGPKQFQKFLINAFNSLPHDPSTWLSFLSEGDARSDALLVLFHFNFLRESVLSNVALYLPLIVAYVLSSTRSKNKRKSTTMQKALWFTFSIAAVSHEDPSAIDSYEVAMTRLFNDLESGDVRQCYTHHPAVVVHALKSTSIVSDKLRGNVVCMWLENGGDVECIVDATSQGDLRNYYCLMEMVKNGSPQTVDVAVNAIFELTKNPVAVEALGNITWEILQQILAPGYQRNDHNATSVLELAAIFEPNQISGSLLVRLLYSLTKFILENQSDLTLVSLGIKNAYQLLILSIRRHDVRGVTMFTNQPMLIEVLKTLAFAKNDPGLSHMCFSCLSILIRYQAAHSVQCESTLKIESEELLDQLYLEQCFGAVKLATDVLTGELERPLIVLKNLFSGSQNDFVIRDMYLQVHVIHSKSGSDGRNLCYGLLVAILNHCRTLNRLEVLKNLCEMDWTYVLIEITFNGKKNMDPAFMDFLSKWLYHRYSVSLMSPPCGDRPFGRDQFEITLDLLGKAAIAKFKKEPEDATLQELIQSLMLYQEHFSGNIGADLERANGQLTPNYINLFLH